MINRIISSALLGFLVTAGLFYLMSTLIATGKDPLSKDQIGKIVDFVRIKQDDVVQRIERKLDKPDKPKAPPPVAPKMQADPFKVGNTQMSTGFNFNPEVNIEANTVTAGEGDYLPIVKVAPIYPRRAADRGIEGYVIVEYMVTKLGTTQDVTVVEAKPPGYFERAAIQTAQKYKYKPKIINGEAVDVAGVRTIIKFQLEDG